MCRVLIIVSFDGDVEPDAFNEDVTSYCGVSSERELTMTVPNNRDNNKKKDEKEENMKSATASLPSTNDSRPFRSPRLVDKRQIK